MKKYAALFFLASVIMAVAEPESTSSTGNDDKSLRLSFDYVPLTTLLDEYIRVSGLEIEKDASFPSPRQKVSLKSNIPLSEAEYLDALRTYIEMHGVSFVENESGRLKVVRASQQELKNRNSASPDRTKLKRRRNYGNGANFNCEYSGAQGTMDFLIADYSVHTGLIPLVSPSLMRAKIGAFKTEKRVTCNQLMDLYEEELESNGIILEGYKDKFVKVLPGPQFREKQSKLPKSSSSDGVQKRLTYAERRKIKTDEEARKAKKAQMLEEMARKYKESKGKLDVPADERKKRIQQDMLELIRQGKTSEHMPIILTPEMEQQLINEGILPSASAYQPSKTDNKKGSAGEIEKIRNRINALEMQLESIKRELEEWKDIKRMLQESTHKPVITETLINPTQPSETKAGE